MNEGLAVLEAYGVVAFGFWAQQQRCGCVEGIHVLLVLLVGHVLTVGSAHRVDWRLADESWCSSNRWFILLDLPLVSRFQILQLFKHISWWILVLNFDGLWLIHFKQSYFIQKAVIVVILSLEFKWDV